MAAGQPLETTQRYGVQITTVDPAQGIVEAIFKTGDARRLGVYTTDVASRWPMVGEAWVARAYNGTFVLDGLWPSTSNANANPGDLVLNAPTGVVRVQGTPDGSGDYTMPRFWPQQSASVSIASNSQTYTTFTSNGWHINGHQWQAMVMLVNGTWIDACTWGVITYTDTSVQISVHNTQTNAASGTIYMTMMTVPTG